MHSSYNSSYWITALTGTSQSGSMPWPEQATLTYACVIYKGPRLMSWVHSTRDCHRLQRCLLLPTTLYLLNKWYCLQLCLLQLTLSSTYQVHHIGDIGRKHETWWRNLVVPFLQESMKLASHCRQGSTSLLQEFWRRLVECQESQELDCFGDALVECQESQELDHIGLP